MRNQGTVLVVSGILSFVAATAYAQVSTGIPPITNTGAFAGIVCNIFNAMFWVLIAISIIMALWAAYQYVTGGDNSETVSSAKMTLFYAAIGLVVAFLAKGAPVLIAGIFNAGSAVQGCGNVPSVNSNINFQQ